MHAFFPELVKKFLFLFFDDFKCECEIELVPRISRKIKGRNYEFQSVGAHHSKLTRLCAGFNRFLLTNLLKKSVGARASRPMEPTLITPLKFFQPIYLTNKIH